MSLKYPALYRSMDVRADATIARAVQQTINDAETLWAPEKFDGPFATKGFGIRKICAADVSKNGSGGWGYAFSNLWGISITTASTWTAWNTAGNTLSNAAYIIITGIYNLDAQPDIEAIKFTADGVEYPVTDISEMYAWDIALAYFSHPIIVRPEKSWILQVKARTVGVKQIGLLGYVIAKRSYLITAM